MVIFPERPEAKNLAIRRQLAAVSLALSAACAGPSAANKKTVAELAASGDFTGAANGILAAQGEYGASNEVLFHLDAAQALADAGRRPEADRHFSLAQDRMEALWTRSVTKLVGAALANENVDDYRGEESERALSHVLRALNLIAMNRREEALVEARRVELFLDEAERSLPRERSYRYDAFARWLAAALYEDLGREDDARISRRAAERAFEGYRRIYGISSPPEPSGRGEAEIVFIHLDGPAPLKVRREGGGPLGLLLQTSYPAYEATPAKVAASQASVGAVSARTTVVEDCAAIAAKDLEERLAGLKTRSTLRAAAKLAGTSLGLQSTDSEFADVRRWSTMPARLRLARLRVPAGPGKLVVRYLDQDARELESKTFPYEASRHARAWIIDRTAR